MWPVGRIHIAQTIDDQPRLRASWEIGISGITHHRKLASARKKL